MTPPPLPSLPALADGAAVPDAAAVLELLAGYLATPLGRAELDRLRFHRDRGVLEEQHRLLAQARAWVAARGSFLFSSIEDPGAWLGRAAAGFGLEGAELLAVLRFLDAAEALRGHVGEAIQWPELSALAQGIPDLSGLARLLRSAILPSGEVDDQASPLLGSLRRQRARQRQAIESSLGQQLKKLGGEGVLRDELVTVRNDRFVLPVRSEQRRRAPGIVHGASSSGQTVFVEPLETVELNNEHIRLLDEEQAEVRRILLELSGRVGAEAEAIGRAAEACGRLEWESAKARFGADYAASPAEFAADHALRLELVAARHPVLVAALRGNPNHAVIPLALALQAQRVLVISGPNTGGKTVVLKTAGMAAWMAQCGLPVCAERALLPIFDGIWADVGDVQSLTQNLSTFSSHLAHIRNILDRAGERTLVLLDELGTATNAAEGAALAVAIADFLRERRVWTLISTHHDALKAWAGARPEGRSEVANGSVAVDPETLRPTYQFRFGVPGLSAGLDMAERLGLPPEVVAAARRQLTAEERQSGEYLRRLQASLSEAEQLRGGLEAREVAVAERERVLEARDRTHHERQMAQLRADVDRRFAAFNAAAESNWRQALAALAVEITDRSQKRKIELAAARLRRETAEAFQREMGTGAAQTSPAAADPRPGDQVRVRSLQAPGRVLRALDDGFEVEVGHLRMRVPRADIAAVLAAPGAAPSSGTRRVLGAAAPDDLDPVREINLIGLRAEEAVEKLDKFLDNAILSAADQIRIVHGAGFGALRRAVAETLKSHPQVASFHQPPQNQGGNGVTIAVMKS